MTPKTKDLSDLFHDTLKDIYFAEKQILKALPKMARAAQSEEGKAGFLKHRDETEGQSGLVRFLRSSENRPEARRAKPFKG